MLANHGFISRDGKNIPVSDLLAELEANFPVVAAIPTGAADGARTLGLFDDDGGVEVLHLSRLHAHGPTGLDHQSSTTRECQVQDDASSESLLVSGELREILLDTNDASIITREEHVLLDYPLDRTVQGRRETDSYSMGGVENTPLASQVVPLLLAFGGNDDLDFASKDVVQSNFFDERAPDVSHNSAVLLFPFRVDFSSEPGMGVGTIFRDKSNTTLIEPLTSACFSNLFLAIGRLLVGWFGITCYNATKRLTCRPATSVFG